MLLFAADTQHQKSTKKDIMETPKLSGFNYVHVTQNTDAWEKIRNHKFTGSRLARIFGFYSSDKFTESWVIVNNASPEKGVRHIIHTACELL